MSTHIILESFLAGLTLTLEVRMNSATQARAFRDPVQLKLRAGELKNALGDATGTSPADLASLLERAADAADWAVCDIALGELQADVDLLRAAIGDYLALQVQASAKFHSST